MRKLPPCDFKFLGGKVLSMSVAYAPDCSTGYPAFLESLGGSLEGLPSGEPKVLLGHFDSNVDKP